MTINVNQEQGNYNVQIPRIVTDSTLAQVQTVGWLNSAINEGFVFPATSLILIAHDQNSSAATTDLFKVSVNSNTHLYTLSLTTNAISGPVVVSDAQTSATPGTVRALVGAMSDSATTLTSGNLVGVRGQLNIVGSSTSFYGYGVQGKLIATGTLASGQFQASVFGQADFSAATINGGQYAPIWGDYGTSVGTVTSASGLYGLAMTNTTAAVLEGNVYLYGGATNLLLLNDNNGAVGTSYFQAAGAGASSCGHVSYVAAAKALQLSINGTNYWLPLFSSNS